MFIFYSNFNNRIFILTVFSAEQDRVSMPQCCLCQNRLSIPLSGFLLGQFQHHEMAPVPLQLTFCFAHKRAGFVAPMTKTDSDFLNLILFSH